MAPACSGRGRRGLESWALCAALLGACGGQPPRPSLPSGPPTPAGSAATSWGNSLWALLDGKFRAGSEDQSKRQISEHLGPYGASRLALSHGRLVQQRPSASTEQLLEVMTEVPKHIFDAVRFSEDELLIAIEDGLYLFDLPTRRLHPFYSPTGDWIAALEVDGRSRVWGLGERLYLIQPRGAAVAFELPFVEPAPLERGPQTRVLSIGDRRIFVPLAERGVLVLDADAIAATSR